MKITSSVYLLHMQINISLTFPLEPSMHKRKFNQYIYPIHESNQFFFFFQHTQINIFSQYFHWYQEYIKGNLINTFILSMKITTSFYLPHTQINISLIFSLERSIHKRKFNQYIYTIHKSNFGSFFLPHTQINISIQCSFLNAS